MRVLGTFQSRDVADSVKDTFIEQGYHPEDLIVMTNRETPEPPEDAKLEVGHAGEGGFAEFEEKLGKAALHLLGKDDKTRLEGDGFEGDTKQGALLGITVKDQAEAEKVSELLKRHFAGDVEIAEAD